MKTFLTIMALSICISMPSYAQNTSQGEHYQSDVELQLNKINADLSEYAIMAGASGACDPQTYPLIHQCSIGIVQGDLEKLKLMGIDGQKAASSFQNKADSIWKSFVTKARDKQLSSDHALTCQQVLESVKSFGEQNCLSGNTTKNSNDLKLQ